MHTLDLSEGAARWAYVQPGCIHAWPFNAHWPFPLGHFVDRKDLAKLFAPPRESGELVLTGGERRRLSRCAALDTQNAKVTAQESEGGPEERSHRQPALPRSARKRGE